MSELIKYQKQMVEFLDNGSSVDNNAHNYHKWFLQNAVLYRVVNKDQSNHLSKRAKLKQCFTNCYKIAFKERTYTLYKFAIMGDLHKGIVNHSRFAGSNLQQFTACLGHFWAANADEFDVVSCLF